MKLITLTLSALISVSAFGVTEKLSFNEPQMMKVKKVVLMKSPIQTNLIRLYQKLPSERRMIAGFKETKIKETSQASLYLDDLREKLKSNGGKIRL